MSEDGNCPFRALARQIYGDQEHYQKVRDETMDYIILHRDYFASFEADINMRLSQQLVYRFGGGDLEIKAISELYNLGILVWEISGEGELVTPIDSTAIAAGEGLKSLYLSRHRGFTIKVLSSKTKSSP